MSAAIIKIHLRCLAGFSQYGLAIGETGEGRGVKAGEGMKRVAFYLISIDRGVNKTQIKMSVVGHHH